MMMKKIMMMVILAILISPSFSFAKKLNEEQVRMIGEQIDDGGLKVLAQKTDSALALMVQRGVDALRDQGFDAEANQYEAEYYAKYDGYVTKMMANERHIGDHKPLIEWLATFYNTLETKVCGGNVQICKALHLSDIKTMNYGIPVVFHPCTFDMNGLAVDRESEYRRHFAHDDGNGALYGVTAVITYWVIEGFCLTSTSGIGSILCGIAAMGGERLMGDVLAPRLSDKLFVRMCDK